MLVAFAARFRAGRCAALLALAFALAACSGEKKFVISGASSLSQEISPEEAVLKVLSYPISTHELDYLANAIEPLSRSAQKRMDLWESLQDFSNPVAAASDNPIWKDAELNGEDVIAITMKLTFLREFSEIENPLEDMRANLDWLEKRALEAENKAELEAAAEQLRGLIRVIETLESSGSLALYRKNKSDYDAALDRFLAIGEQ